MTIIYLDAQTQKMILSLSYFYGSFIYSTNLCYVFDSVQVKQANKKGQMAAHIFFFFDTSWDKIISLG